MLVCGLVIFELAVVIGLLVYAGLSAKRELEKYNLRWAELAAYLDAISRNGVAIKNDIDLKFGPDLVEKINALFKLGAHPNQVVLGKDGQFHKANGAY
ncbi:MAG: hypothetical protein PHC68_12485 [Syntrophorhabdaceae bacterium]|nr:hypothetical protein [Syntrophorhabdaceae bacterium]